MRVICITPWKGGQDRLLTGYAHLVSRADLVVAVDNEDKDWEGWPDAWLVTDGAPEQSFSASNNQGRDHLRIDSRTLHEYDIMVFLNSDTAGDPGWVDTARDQVQPGFLYGQSMASTRACHAPISGDPGSIPSGDVPYLEGWFLAATAATWDRIGWWPEWDGIYWEDAMLSLNAMRAGVVLRHIDWGIKHLTGQTTRTRPGLPREFFKSRAKFIEEGGLR